MCSKKLSVIANPWIGIAWMSNILERIVIKDFPVSLLRFNFMYHSRHLPVSAHVLANYSLSALAVCKPCVQKYALMLIDQSDSSIIMCCHDRL